MEIHVNRPIVLFFIKLVLLVSILTSVDIYAQIILGEELEPLPQRQMTDSYGIDLLSGTANIPGINVNIGTAESGITYYEKEWNDRGINFNGTIYFENTAHADAPIDADPEVGS